MTSQLRRKRPTTARSIPPATVPFDPSFFHRYRGPYAALQNISLILTALGLLGIAAIGRAASPTADDIQSSHVEQCSYTAPADTDSPHHRWRPYRPQPIEKNESGTAPAIIQAAAEAPIPGNDPFSDPFSDGAPQAVSNAVKAVPVRTANKTAIDSLSSSKVPDFPAITPPSPISNSMVKAVPIKSMPIQSTPSTASVHSANRTPAEDTQALDKQLASNAQLDNQCPKSDAIKPINKINLKINPDTEQSSQGQLPPECPIARTAFAPRSWVQTDFTWTASQLCHKPLYFEYLQAERYGHTWGPFLQPIVSAGHFFVNIPLLPYNMGVDTPHECIYTLGFYRPGSCAPYMIDPFPLSVRGALFEAGAIVGGAYLFTVQ